MVCLKLNESLFCERGIHSCNATDKTSEFGFEESPESGTTCCSLSDRLSQAVAEQNSHMNINSMNHKGDAFQSYERSRDLQDLCRPAVIASDPEECALIRDLQEQRKLRKNLLPLSLGPHLLRWPTYQTTLSVYFHFGLTGPPDGSQVPVQVELKEDPISGIRFPKSIVPHPFKYPDPIYLSDRSSLKSFQFNLVAISADSIAQFEWQQYLFKQLFEEGRCGRMGERHNFVFPFIICPNREEPEFVPRHVMRHCFLLCRSGQFVGDLALKLILPFILWTNRQLGEHVSSLTSSISKFNNAISSQTITEFVIAFFDIYNASHHLIIYSPLSTVISRHFGNRQLHASVVQLIQRITSAAQILMVQIGPLHLNASLDASGVVGKLELRRTVDARYKDYLQYERVEGLVFGGPVWLLASLPENYLDTEYVKDGAALKAGIDFLSAYFKIFLSERELEAEPTDATITFYRFDPEKGLYCKTESTCDAELEASRELSPTTILSHTQSFAAPTQCVSTDSFRFLYYLLEYSPSGVEVERLCKLLHVALRLCLYRTLPVRNRSCIEARRDCFPAFPFKRWASVVGTDRFGNPKPGWSNPFNPLYLLLFSGLSFILKNMRHKNIGTVLPTYFEVVFQVVYPVGNLLKLVGHSLHQKNFNNSEICEWVLKLNEIIIRPLHKYEYIASIGNYQSERFFCTIQNYWKDFNESNLELIVKILREKQENLFNTKIPGGFGMLKFDGHLQSPGPVSPENTQSQSYGDPVFEALHLQVPLLLFSPSGVSRYLFALQKFAFDAHPVQRTLLCTPSHCLYLYHSKSAPNSHAARRPGNSQSQHSASSLSVSTSGASASTSTSASTSFVDWCAFERIGSLPAHLASLRSLLDSQDPLVELDETEGSSTTSSSAMSLAFSSSNSDLQPREMPTSANESSERVSVTAESAENWDFVVVSAQPEAIIESFEQLIFRGTDSD